MIIQVQPSSSHGCQQRPGDWEPDVGCGLVELFLYSLERHSSRWGLMSFSADPGLSGTGSTGVPMVSKDSKQSLLCSSLVTPLFLPGPGSTLSAALGWSLNWISRHPIFAEYCLKNWFHLILPKSTFVVIIYTITAPSHMRVPETLFLFVWLVLLSRMSCNVSSIFSETLCSTATFYFLMSPTTAWSKPEEFVVGRIFKFKFKSWINMKLLGLEE